MNFNELPYKSIDDVIRECYLYHEGVWPKQLTSGILFFRGSRITYAEFMKAGRGE